MSQLPIGWANTSLSELIELKYGKALPDRERSGDGFPVFGSNGIVGYHNTALTVGATVVIGRKGSVGEVNFSEISCSPIDTTYYVDSFPGGQSKFWYYKLRSLPLKELNKSTAIPGVSRSDVYPLEITLPPLPEQKRIADKLDSVLARVDACRDRLDRLPALLKRFRQSILAAATSGRLTEDWRETNGHNLELLNYAEAAPPVETDEIPESWIWVAIGDLSSKVADGVHKKPQYVEAGIPFLTVRNLTAGPGLDFSKTSFITESDHAEFCKRTFPEPGDLLVSKDGTLGVIRLIDTDRPFSIFVSLALIKPRDRRISKYLRFALEAPVLQKQMTGVGTGLLHIHLRDLRQDIVPLPPIEEQTEIVRRVELLFAFADRLEARLAAARQKVGQLTPALLAKAFRGELVAQDPADEPAAELLKRLAAQREAAPKARRGRASKA